jgi:hypothetical protein
METLKDTRGKHNINLFVSHELKKRIQRLADEHDRPVAAMTRQIILIGLKLYEGFSAAEKVALGEIVRLTRPQRKRRLLNAVQESSLNLDSARNELHRRNSDT